MAKILVADDNSNVQRTVTLALSDYGVEVVAVNNGEAAVRKLADFTPDLILADIFMPVRNGYEVCEYVKHAPQFAQTPVVLLVGAFDPFDEREAQRVGADGILKKPFVPPDPLIAMVRTLLDRVMASRPVPAAVSAGPAAITQRTVNNSVRKVYPPVEESPEEAPEDFGSHERVAFGDGEAPVAFGELYESPVAAVESPEIDGTAVRDEGLILTSKRDAALGDPGFWRKDDADSEPAFEGALVAESDSKVVETPTSVEHAWEPATEAVAESSAETEAEPVEAASTIEVSPENEEEVSTTVASANTAFELVQEVPDEVLTTASAASIRQDPAENSELHVDVNKAVDLASSPLDWMASATATPVEITEDAVEETDEVVHDAKAAEEPVERLEEEKVQTLAKESLEEADEPVFAAPVAAAPVITVAPAFVIPVAPIVPAAPAVPFAAEVSAAPVAVIPPVVIPEPAPVVVLVPAASRVAEVVPELPAKVVQPTAVEENPVETRPEPVIAAKVEIPAPAASSKWSDLVDVVEETSRAAIEFAKPSVFKEPVKPEAPREFARVEPAKTESAKVEPIKIPVSVPGTGPEIQPQAAAPVVAADVPAEPAHLSSSVAPDPAVVDAVVARVLEKMSPQVIDIITREFLRPVVQALVKREVEKH